MTYTHIACTNTEDKRVIQPINPLQLSFIERSDGTAAAIHYIAGNPIQANVREKFSDILEMMTACGACIDCTKEREWDVDKALVTPSANPNYGGGALAPGYFPEGARASEINSETPVRLIENLKKQLAAKDDEITSIKRVSKEYSDACSAINAQLRKLAEPAMSIKTGAEKLGNEIWSRQTEIHRLNALLAQRSKQVKDLQDTISKYQERHPEQPEPPARALSDEAQGLNSGDGVTGD